LSSGAHSQANHPHAAKRDLPVLQGFCPTTTAIFNVHQESAAFITQTAILMFDDFNISPRNHIFMRFRRQIRLSSVVWHVTCNRNSGNGQEQTRNMANKLKIAKYASQPRPLSRPAPQRPAVKPAGLYLLELRTHVAQARPPIPRPKLKQTIPIEAVENGDGIPQPVKITHS
jgi:hypothetical protein